METTPIMYIGVRERYTDGLFGTGAWERDQIKLVPKDVATKMQTHAAVYVETKVAKKEVAAGESVKTSDEVEVVEINHPTEEKKQLDQVEELETQVNGMNKAALLDFAQSRFGKKLDGRTSAADARTEVIRLIHQFGPQ